MPVINRTNAVEREILRSLWKVHILWHASRAPIVGNWMLSELREHGYNVSPGTLYPLLKRMEKLGWLVPVEGASVESAKSSKPYRATSVGKRVLKEVNARLKELSGEVRF